MTVAHTFNFLASVARTCEEISPREVDALVYELAELRDRKGRLFILGVGGSAANASHAVNDFRKLCNIEAYAPTDNVSELTARTNDDGWDTVFKRWLSTSRLDSRDAIFVLSVGGGNAAYSGCISRAVDFAGYSGAKVFGIVGRPDGMTAMMGDAVIVIPAQEPEWITPLSETFQAVLWHCIVNHPVLRAQ